MKIAEQSYMILAPAGIIHSTDEDIPKTFDSETAMKSAFIAEAMLIEIAGRTAYKSEDKITDDSYDPFIRKIIRRGHEAVIEFGSMTAKFVTDRGISHELVRHRVCSFIQESTRYCNYGAKKFGSEITVIKPSTWDNWTESMRIDWQDSIRVAETRYLNLLRIGATPQQARSILPNSLKTEIVVRTNFREWRHIFQLRAIEKAAHPDMRTLMIPLYQRCRGILPCVFDMGDPE
jgi:thymidylate synthase (FAD)